MVTRKFEQHLYELLGVSSPLAHDRGSADVKECRAALSCDSLCQHGLACAWRSEEQDTLPRLEYALEEVRILHRHQYRLLEQALCFT